MSIAASSREQADKDKKSVYGQPPFKSSKRQHLDEEEQEKSVKKMKQYPSTSFVLLSNLRKYQAKERALLIGRPYDCVSTPLVLYNSVFSDFKRDYNTENLPMNKEHYRWTLETIELMADFYMDENSCQKVFHEQLRILFGQEVTEDQLEDKSSNDGVLNFCTRNLLYLLIGIKNEIDAGYDPVIWAADSYAKYYTQSKNHKFLKGCNMPCFIIALAGPWISVLGAVYVEKPVIEPLTAFEPLIHVNDLTHSEKIARLFKALHLGSDSLKNYYDSLPYTTVNNEDSQRYYLCLREVENVGEFFYTEKFNDKLLWRAETKKGCRQIIVKYMHRYNKNAHELCSNIGKAPGLLHVRTTCGFYYVVMEYIEGVKLRDCFLSRSEYDKIFKDIEKAISLLHLNDIVFADLRGSNILVIKDENKECRGMLVDFDWAGTNNVDSYPPFMNPSINWPTGAQARMPLKIEHDIYWLNYLKKLYCPV
ncbi:unnamed protein product [Rhizophagus irregularis]|nr:unnamed protein product [Rhizophagus irregularis]